MDRAYGSFPATWTDDQGRLLFIVNALKKLLEEEHFVTLLRAEATAPDRGC